MLKTIEDSNQILCDLYSTINNAIMLKDEVMDMFYSARDRKKILMAINDIKKLRNFSLCSDAQKNPNYIFILQEASDFLNAFACGTDIFEGNKYLTNGTDGLTSRLSEAEVAHIHEITLKIEDVFLNSSAKMLFKYVNDVIRVVDLFKKHDFKHIILQLNKEENLFFLKKIKGDGQGKTKFENQFACELSFAFETGEALPIPMLVNN